MPYSESLAHRVRGQLAQRKHLQEKKMFGGLAFLLNGNMCVGVWRDSLIARVGPDQYHAALQEAFAREFDITGRPMKGWVLIAPEGVESDAQLQDWLERSVAFAASLPPK